MGEVAVGRREGGLGGRARGGDQGWGRWGWVAATGLGAPGARTGEPQGTSPATRPAAPHTRTSSGRRAGVGQDSWWATSSTSLWVQMEARAWWSMGVRLVRLVRAAPRGWGSRWGLGKPGLEAWWATARRGRAGAER